jgi:Pentapeptide repeats (8 copies)
MADKEHVEILKQGFEAWTAWRNDSPGILPDLSGADLSNAKLEGANLRDANLSHTNLNRRRAPRSASRSYGANPCR